MNSTMFTRDQDVWALPFVSKAVWALAKKELTKLTLMHFIPQHAGLKAYVSLI